MIPISREVSLNLKQVFSSNIYIYLTYIILQNGYDIVCFKKVKNKTKTRISQTSKVYPVIDTYERKNVLFLKILS